MNTSYATSVQDTLSTQPPSQNVFIRVSVVYLSPNNTLSDDMALKHPTSQFIYQGRNHVSPAFFYLIGQLSHSDSNERC